jgi:hypothetical protein
MNCLRRVPECVFAALAGVCVTCAPVASQEPTLPTHMCVGSRDSIPESQWIRFLSDGRANAFSSSWRRVSLLSDSGRLGIVFGDAPTVNDARYVGLVVEHCVWKGGWRSRGFLPSEAERARLLWNSSVPSVGLTVETPTAAQEVAMLFLTYATGRDLYAVGGAPAFARSSEQRIDTVAVRFERTIPKDDGWGVVGQVVGGPRFAVGLTTSALVSEVRYEQQ